MCVKMSFPFHVDSRSSDPHGEGGNHEVGLVGAAVGTSNRKGRKPDEPTFGTLQLAFPEGCSVWVQ